MIYRRFIADGMSKTLAFGKSILLLGPRQTGKTTLVKSLPHDLYINLMDINVFFRYKRDLRLILQDFQKLKEKLGRKPCIIIDEVQRFPDITDVCQILIDEGEATFIITSSSARKIRNLLPGRIILFKLSTLTQQEYGGKRDLDGIFNNGFLPEICSMNEQVQIENQLTTYVSTYLEEIRQEALVKNLEGFVNFLKLACIKSGEETNFCTMSQSLGISAKTIQSYYRILEDCLIVRRIDPIRTGKAHRKLSKSVRYILFDMGIRRLGAIEPKGYTEKEKDFLLEQYVGSELYTLMESGQQRMKVLFWRDHNGPEVDFVLEVGRKFIPIEVKLTSKSKEKDVRHLRLFRSEYPVKDKCYLISDVPYAYEFEKGIVVLPWFELHKIFEVEG